MIFFLSVSKFSSFGQAFSYSCSNLNYSLSSSSNFFICAYVSLQSSSIRSSSLMNTCSSNSLSSAGLGGYLALQLLANSSSFSFFSRPCTYFTRAQYFSYKFLTLGGLYKMSLASFERFGYFETSTSIEQGLKEPDSHGLKILSSTAKSILICSNSFLETPAASRSTSSFIMSKSSSFSKCKFARQSFLSV